jgi:hypothetical protein
VSEVCGGLEGVQAGWMGGCGVRWYQLVGMGGLGATGYWS